MIRIELTGQQKLQISIILLALGVAIFALLRNRRPHFDPAVNGWSYPQKVQKDTSKPPGPNNPWDPEKESVVNLFTCYDGQLEIREFRNDATKRPAITWVKLDPRHQQHIYYQDPMAPVYEEKDPYGHAIALAAYSAADGQLLGLLTTAGLSADQIAEEKKARTEMLAALGVTTLSVETGGFHPELMTALMSALDAYRKAPGNPMENSDKAARARDVLAAASAVLAKLNEEKSAFIDKYISKMNEVLTKDQKAKLVLAAKAYEAQHPKLVGGRGAAPKPAQAKPVQPKPAANRGPPARGRGNPPAAAPPG